MKTTIIAGRSMGKSILGNLLPAKEVLSEIGKGTKHKLREIKSMQEVRAAAWKAASRW